VHLTIEVSIVDCAITNVIAADRHINDKAVRAIKTKVHNLDITLLVACGACCGSDNVLMQELFS